MLQTVVGRVLEISAKKFVTDRLKSVHGKSVHFELQTSKNFIFPHLSRFC
jgi:hypothetical protein